MRTDDRAAQTTRRGIGRSRRKVARGQAIVEFALVAPLFIMILFGIIEFSFISASVASFNFAAKDAARLGSLLGRTDPNVDSELVSLIKSHVSGVVMAKIVKIEIFKSDVAGDTLSGANGPIEDVYDSSGNAIGTPYWTPNLRNDSLLNADYLGVRITYVYTYLTGFISGGASSLQLTAISVQRIEPQDYQSRHVVPGALALRAWAPDGGPPGGMVSLAPGPLWMGGRDQGGAM